MKIAEFDINLVTANWGIHIHTDTYILRFHRVLVEMHWNVRYEYTVFMKHIVNIGRSMLLRPMIGDE